MNDSLLATYHDVYHYFELYEDYIQIHQAKTGVIPFPTVLKNDGEKFYFNDLKKVSFLRGVAEDNSTEEDMMKHNTIPAYACTLQFKNGKVKIKSFIHYSGWGQQDNADEFRLFMDALIPIIENSEAKVYGLTSVPTRLKKHLKFKIGGISLGSTLVLELIVANLLEEFFSSIGEYYGLTNMAIFAGIFLSIFLSINYFYEKFLKKKITWKDVVREYIPPLSLERQKELESSNKNQ